jgi:hypothetical protein
LVIYGYSFILTNPDTSTSYQAAAVEAWHRNRTDIEEMFKQCPPQHAEVPAATDSGDRWPPSTRRASSTPIAQRPETPPTSSVTHGSGSERRKVGVGSVAEFAGAL